MLAGSVAVTAVTGTIVAVLMGVTLAMEMIVVMGMTVIVAVSMGMLMAVGMAVVGMLVGMGMGVLMVMSAAQGIVMNVHIDRSFAFFLHYNCLSGICQNISFHRTPPGACTIPKNKV
jgi:hypothetical protein